MEEEKLKTEKNLGWVSFFKKVSLQPVLEWGEIPGRAYIIREIIPNPWSITCKTMAKMFFYLYIDAKCGTSSSAPLDWLLRVLYTLCLGLRKGSKYFWWPLCRNLFWAVKTERYMIGNHWRLFSMGLFQLLKFSSTAMRHMVNELWYWTLQLWNTFTPSCEEH